MDLNLQSVSATPDDDLDLARRIGARDERAFEALMRLHNRMLYRLARSILRDDAEAEDAVQEAYLAGYRNIDRFRGGAKLSTWLARIVINEAYGRLRKRRQTAAVVPLEQASRSGDRDDADLEGRIMVDEKGERPDAAAMRAELRRILERRIDALPEQFRTVFILRDVEELSVEETAECLDVPPATVRTRAFRARALLREALSREIDAATVDAFGFAGERCDRIVANVLQQVRLFNPLQETS
jgi:RNA polymerase sigma-70 factor, ECF subfamily